MQLVEDTAWLERAQNCLIFGPSGTGKTHLAISVARRSIELGKRTKFFAAPRQWQQLQDAKLQLQLHPLLKKLDRYDLLVLPFSQWDHIFTDSMMTVAAIDRLVHHGVIFEVQAQSYRKQVAAQRGAKSSKQ
jgi:DNA replication protein DnaC